MTSDRIMSFQIFCFHWITSQQIVWTLIERKNWLMECLCVWLAEILAQNLKDKCVIRADYLCEVKPWEYTLWCLVSLQARHSCPYDETSVVQFNIRVTTLAGHEDAFQRKPVWPHCWVLFMLVIVIAKSRLGDSLLQSQSSSCPSSASLGRLTPSVLCPLDS